MAILKKNLYFALFLILLISISGCSGKKTSQSVEEMRVGTEGLVINFVPNNPPDKIHVEQGAEELSRFEAVLEVRNKGAYPQPDENIPAPIGKIFLSGYDTNILEFDKNPPIEETSNKPLDGKSTINPNGGLDFITFKGKVLVGNLNVERYEPIIQATACYLYRTIAGPSVCIDPNPYSTVKERKVCEVKDITLASQGAPMAITKIEEEAFATKTQFKITIKNVGGGDVLHHRSIDKCSPTGEKIGREDVDKVYIIWAKIGAKSLTCGPFATNQGGVVKGVSGDIRLLNGEGFAICELPSQDYANTKSAYLTPIEIQLMYGYRTSIDKKIVIQREVSGLGSASAAYPATESMPSSAPPSSTGLPSTSSPQSAPLQDGQTYLYCAESDPLTGECIRTADSCPKRDPGTGECIT